MTTLRPAPVGVVQFSYDHPTRTLSAEMSSLNGFGRVYDDSIDEGLTIVGTRDEIVFVVESVYYDPEGELGFWTLKSLDGYFTATVYND